MKKYSKTTANIYGMISLFIIIGVIFSVGFSINRNNENSHNTTVVPSVAATISNDSKKLNKKIYNPYETVNFDTCKMTRMNVLSDTNIVTADSEFLGVFMSGEKYSSKSSEEFLGEIKDTNDLFAVSGLYKTSNLSSKYVSLVKNKNIVGLEISDGEYAEKSVKVWDEVLTSVMPQLTILGISKDVILLSEDNKKETERNAIISGHYFSLTSNSNDKELPEIKAITINNNVIRIRATNYIRIEWITENGKISGFGEEINPYATDIQQWNSTDKSVSRPSKYVRAVIIGENGLLYTQAFGLQ